MVRGRLTTIALGAAAVVLVATWCLVLADLQPLWVGEDVVAARAQAAVAPIVVALDDMGSFFSEARELYLPLMLLGACLCALAVIAGGYFISHTAWARPTEAIQAVMTRGADAAPLRVAIMLVLCAVGMVGSFAYMGFVPALSAGRLAAKFFNGEFAVRYRPRRRCTGSPRLSSPFFCRRSSCSPISGAAVPGCCSRSGW